MNFNDRLKRARNQDEVDYILRKASDKPIKVSKPSKAKVKTTAKKPKKKINFITKKYKSSFSKIKGVQPYKGSGDLSL